MRKVVSLITLICMCCGTALVPSAVCSPNVPEAIGNINTPVQKEIIPPHETVAYQVQESGDPRSKTFIGEQPFIEGEPFDSASSEPGIRIFPASITVSPAEIVSFTAEIEDVGNEEILWRIYEKNGGMISRSGVYSAPDNPGEYHVFAYLKTDPGSTASATVTVAAPSLENVDFGLSGSDISVSGSLKPGNMVTLRAKVHNLSGSGSVPGGAVIRFKVDGLTVGEAPFYMSGNDTVKNVTTGYYIPEGPYIGLDARQQLPLRIEAEIDPGGFRSESDEGNNAGSATVSITGNGDKPLEDTGPGVTVVSTGLSAYSVMDSAASDRINAAQPGIRINIRAILGYESSEPFENINLRFFVNDVLIKNDYKKIYRPGQGKTPSVSCEYMVPYDCGENLECRVDPGNGESAYLTIPIVPWDFRVSDAFLAWTSNSGMSKTAVPGENISFSAFLQSSAGLESPTDNARVCMRFLVNGDIVDEKWIKLTGNVYTFYSDSFTVPENVTDPLELTVVADPYGLFTESDESNNIASLIIPVAESAGPNTDFSVSPEGLSYARTEALPGSRIDLTASIRNNAWAFLDRSLRVVFKIDGVEVYETDIPKNQFRPGQNHILTTAWTVPENQVSDPVFEVVLDPDRTFSGENSDDNQASSTIGMARPDVCITADDVSCEPEVLTAGGTGVLHATVRNIGLAPARDCTVIFHVNGREVGRQNVMVPGSGAAETEMSFSVPQASTYGAVPDVPLTGSDGYVSVPDGPSSAISFRVEAVPGGLAADSNMANNSSPDSEIPVVLPGQKATLYVQPYYGSGFVSDVRVQYSNPSGATAEACTEHGCCTFTGVPCGNYALMVSKAGYDTATVQGSMAPGVTVDAVSVPLTMNDQMGAVTADDADGDTMSDSDEQLFGCGMDDPDSDDDGVVDGKDLSPLLDPVETDWNAWQRPGMIRTAQPVKGYGLDGWVDVYDVDYHLTSPAITLEYVKTYEDEGTKKSRMSHDTFADTLDLMLEDQGFEVWMMEDIAPEDINIPDFEWEADKVFDFRRLFGGDALHPTQYHYCYDMLTDYMKAYIKNSGEMKFPDADHFYQYMLLPVAMQKDREQCISIQFMSDDAWQCASYTDDEHYRLPALMYAFHVSDDFDNDLNMPFHDGLAVTSMVAVNYFETDLILPMDDADHYSGWLKITPVMVEKNGEALRYTPLDLSGWDVTGLSRTVVYSRDSSGNSISVTQEFTSFFGLNTSIASPESVKQLQNAPNAQSKSEWIGIVSKEGSGDDTEYTIAEITRDTVNMVKGAAEVLTDVYTYVENRVTDKLKIDDVSDLPDSHWLKSAKYNNVLLGIAAVNGAVTMATNGEAAWQAFQDGEYVDVVYYSAKTLTAGVSAAVELVEITKNTLSTGQKAGKFAKLVGKKAAVGLAVAVGVIEVAYDIYKLNATDDKILKIKYKEKIEGDIYDTGISVAAVFFPPVLLTQILWTVELEVYSWVFGENFAYRVGASPGSFLTFLRKYFITEGIIYEMADEAYAYCRDQLIDRIIREKSSRHLSIFINPDL